MRIILLLMSIMISQYAIALENTVNGEVKTNYKSPMKDLKAAIEKKDYRFIAITGVGITGATYVHGIKESGIKGADFPFPKKHINGGGCVVTPLTDMKYKYMIEYNKSLIKHLSENGLLDEMGLSEMTNDKAKKIILK